MTKEELRIQRPLPSPLVILLALVSTLTILSGAAEAADALNHNQPIGYPIAAFLAGRYLAAAAYAVRRLQLIEWRINLPSDAAPARSPSPQPATGCSTSS